MKRGDIVSVSDTGPVAHPGVVLEVSPNGERAYVAHGSSKRRTYLPYRSVPRDSREAKAAGFTRDTFFYGDRIRWFHKSLLGPWNGRALETLIRKLRYLDDEQAKLDSSAAVPEGEIANPTSSDSTTEREDSPKDPECA